MPELIYNYLETMIDSNDNLKLLQEMENMLNLN